MANMPVRGQIKGGKGAKNPVKTFKRLLAYTFSKYKVATVVMIICVLISSSASAGGALIRIGQLTHKHISRLHKYNNTRLYISCRCALFFCLQQNNDVHCARYFKKDA
jgi:hypothetical protein